VFGILIVLCVRVKDLFSLIHRKLWQDMIWSKFSDISLTNLFSTINSGKIK